MNIIKPQVVWITGLSGAGKTTIARLLLKKIKKFKPIHLDGDELRDILSITNKNTFSKKDRIKIGLIYSKLSKYLYDQGHLVIVSVMALNSKTFNWNKKYIKNYFEIFLDVPIYELQKRDPKGMYIKARNGEISNFTGISSPYESPENPEIHIINNKISLDDASNKIHLSV